MLVNLRGMMTWVLYASYTCWTTSCITMYRQLDHRNIPPHLDKPNFQPTIEQLNSYNHPPTTHTGQQSSIILYRQT